VNVAGLFFSTKKCATHANPYPLIKLKKINLISKDKKKFIKKYNEKVVPMKCNSLVVLWLCSDM
jgi:hypothetical protein